MATELMKNCARLYGRTNDGFATSSQPATFLPMRAGRALWLLTRRDGRLLRAAVHGLGVSPGDRADDDASGGEPKPRPPFRKAAAIWAEVHRPLRNPDATGKPLM
jgi:hypothetical protein